jgi:enamidase
VLTLAITNAGTLLSGDLERPIVDGADTVVCRDGKIAAIGRHEAFDGELRDADRVLDAQGTTVAPGLIDSHCHVVLGDYTPRQKTVDFLDSYVHGGITSAISAGEVHAPGRPRDAAGVKALAVAARACFLNFRPSGMRVHAGSVILEPTLTEDDFTELARAGVWLAKYGFGAYADPLDGEPQIRWAQRHGLKVMCHSGGASIPGTKPITPDHLVRLRPDVCGHVNGGPTAMPDAGVDMLVRETELVLQIVQAGNIRSTVRLVKLAREVGALNRLIVGSDTPTGTGVIPLAIIKTVAEIAALTGLDPAVCWALATGNNAHVYGLASGRLAVGAEADLIVMDAPWGSAGSNALEALAIGDIPGISAVVIEGVVCTLRSRNTPAAGRAATLRVKTEVRLKCGYGRLASSALR